VVEKVIETGETIQTVREPIVNLLSAIVKIV